MKNKGSFWKSVQTGFIV